MITISFVVMIALISTTNGIYAQENKITIMDKSYKYFAIQGTRSSVPDNFPPRSTVSSNCYCTVSAAR
jgi:hypothetical protein